MGRWWSGWDWAASAMSAESLGILQPWPCGNPNEGLSSPFVVPKMSCIWISWQYSLKKLALSSICWFPLNHIGSVILLLSPMCFLPYILYDRGPWSSCAPWVRKGIRNSEQWLLVTTLRFMKAKDLLTLKVSHEKCKESGSVPAQLPCLCI